MQAMNFINTLQDGYAIDVTSYPMSMHPGGYQKLARWGVEEVFSFTLGGLCVITDYFWKGKMQKY